MRRSPHKKEKESNNSDLENNDDFEEYESSNIFNNIENQNLEFSINDYVYKLRKKLLEKTSQNQISDEEKKNDDTKNFQVQHGKKKNMAFNLSLIPFIKFRINPIETMDEIIYIFSKKTRTLNEVIYLQHLLNLYDQKYFSNLKNDTFDINEVMFNISICLNMHKLQQNEILFKYGDINDKLFFLLSGNVTLLETVEKKCYMSIEQYIEYLNQLINIGEYQLIRKVIDRNKVYKNNNVVIKIKNNNEKEIKKIMNENIKINKGITKLHHIANIEFNLNVESKIKFEFPRDINYPKEIISVEDYIKRVLPPFVKEKDNKKKKVLFSDIKEKGLSSSYNQNKGRNKHVVVYYSYSLKQNISPFNIIGELSQDNEVMDKSGLTNQNKKKGELSLTAICTEPSILLYLNLNTYEKFVKQRQDSITTKNVNSILEIPFFKGLNTNVFKEKYYKYFTLYNYKNGEYIFRQGEKMNNIYFIKSGEIELTMEASMNDINNILAIIKKKNMKEMNQNDLINKNKKKKKIILNNEDEENIEILKKIKGDKNVKKWRIMRINYKDIIGLSEILDLEDKYYMSAKCMSYIGEIFVIDYFKFIEMLNDDKGMKNLFWEYCIKKEKLIYERLNSIKNIFINDKFKVQKKKLLKTLSWKETKTMNFNNLSKKRNDINLDLINSAIENSNSANNIHLNSDNNKVIKNNEEKPMENQILDLSFEENKNRLRSARYSYKTKINFTGRNRKEFGDVKTPRNSKKIKLKKALSFFNDNDEKEILINQRYNSENAFKVHKFKKSKSYFGLVKFKDFNNLIKSSRNSDKKTMNFNSEINPNFKKYLKEVKKYRLDSAKSPKINAFSKVFFPFQKDNINIKSHFFNFIGFSNKLENFNFHKIECLVLDKFIDAKEYKKNKEKNDRYINNKRQLSVKELKKSIKLMYTKNKFPQHLIRRLEGERKINYFPEKLLHFQNKKGIYILG